MFSAQGTGSSHLAAAKFVDAIARLPGNDGADLDASGAYTQTSLKGTRTFITPPKDWWTTAMHDMKKKTVNLQS